MMKLNTKNNHPVRRNISCGILLAFIINTVLMPVNSAFAQGTVLSLPGSFQPPVLLGLKIHPENPLLFDFIVDQGQAKLSTDELKDETTKLVKYFLAALTIPDKEVWVNLSPTEKDRIIPDVLGQTTMGKTMLEQDYVLKQLAASLTNPDTDLGKKYWDQVNVSGTCVGARCSVPLQTFNKVWIMPAKAEVLESNGIVLVGEKRLKVMMAEDRSLDGQQSVEIDAGAPPTAHKNDTVEPRSIMPLQHNVISSHIFRTTILPTIEKAVNEGKDFADVRQIYNSVILAAWYKKALKESLLGKIYTDKSKVAGVETDDKQMKQRIYEQYVAAFKKGAYNLIKEEADESGDLIPRKYFSGGITPLATDVITIAASPAQMKSRLDALSTVSSAAVELAAAQNEFSVVSTAVGIQADNAMTVYYYGKPYFVDEVVNILNKVVAYWNNPANKEKVSYSNVGKKTVMRIPLLSPPIDGLDQRSIRSDAFKLQNIFRELRFKNSISLQLIMNSYIGVNDNFEFIIALPNSRKINPDDVVKTFVETFLPLIREEIDKYSGNSDLLKKVYWGNFDNKTAAFLRSDLEFIREALVANYRKLNQQGNYHVLKADLSSPRLEKLFSDVQEVIAVALGDSKNFKSKKAKAADKQTYPMTNMAAYVNGNAIHITLARNIISDWSNHVLLEEKLSAEFANLDMALVKVKGVHLMPDLSVVLELEEDGVLETVKQRAGQVAEANGETPKFFSGTFVATVAYLYGKDISAQQLQLLYQSLGKMNTELRKSPITVLVDKVHLETGTLKRFAVTDKGRALQLSASSTVASQPAVASAAVGGIDFDPTNMNLQIKRDGKGVPLPLPQQNLEQINIQGLFPVIINITPINAQTLPIFLGQAPKEPAKEPELAVSTSS